MDYQSKRQSWPTATVQEKIQVPARGRHQGVSGDDAYPRLAGRLPNPKPRRAHRWTMLEIKRAQGGSRTAASHDTRNPGGWRRSSPNSTEASWPNSRPPTQHVRSSCLETPRRSHSTALSDSGRGPCGAKTWDSRMWRIRWLCGALEEISLMVVFWLV